MEDDLKKEEEKKGRRPKKNKKWKTTSTKKWKTNQSTKINLIGCDTILNSPSSYYYCLTLIVIPSSKQKCLSSFIGLCKWTLIWPIYVLVTTFSVQIWERKIWIILGLKVAYMCNTKLGSQILLLQPNQQPKTT